MADLDKGTEIRPGCSDFFDDRFRSPCKWLVRASEHSHLCLLYRKLSLHASILSVLRMTFVLVTPIYMPTISAEYWHLSNPVHLRTQLPMRSHKRPRRFQKQQDGARSVLVTESEYQRYSASPSDRILPTQDPQKRLAKLLHRKPEQHSPPLSRLPEARDPLIPRASHCVCKNDSNNIRPQKLGNACAIATTRALPRHQSARECLTIPTTR
jgi:hypothetical protein